MEELALSGGTRWRAVIRVDGAYERQLVRIENGAGLDELTALMNEKYSSQATPAAIDAGDLWMFEAAPRAVVGRVNEEYIWISGCRYGTQCF